jgi:uncharacterized protein (DUF58 family)
MPLLAGECSPRLNVAAADTRGFIRLSQTIEPLQLHVIPRARYAEWLANKYLEQSGGGSLTMTALSAKANALPRGRAEYFGSRAYQPGDPMKDIDWKHASKLNQLIVREYAETNDQTAILVVNLTAGDAEEADLLAFKTITAALTLAQQQIPTALAAYNHEGVFLIRGLTDPDDILRQALSLSREIKTARMTNRCLEPTDIARIRRNIALLRQADSEPARRLTEVLSFERRAIEEAAAEHPATLALTEVTELTPAPAMIFLISSLNHDAEAVLVTTEKLSRRSFTTVPVDIDY